MKKFYTCKYDRAFKEVFMKEENKDILEKVLETILKVKIEKIRFLNLERNVDNIKVKRKHLDLYLETDIGKIQVEVNTENPKYLNSRNMAYISDIYSHHILVGEEYNEKTLIIQINMSYDIKNEEYIRKYLVQDDKGNKYVKNLIIYEINMEKYKSFWYNKNQEEIEKNKYLLMLDLGLKDLGKLSIKDKVVSKYMSEIERVNEEPEFREYMSAEEDNRKIENSIRSEGYELGIKQGLEKGLKEGIEQGKKEGHKQGKKEGIEEIVKKMMKQNYSKEEIKQITGIDLKDE